MYNHMFMYIYTNIYIYIYTTYIYIYSLYDIAKPKSNIVEPGGL